MVLALGLYCAVFGTLFGPVLTGDETVVHGDAVSVSLPLQHVLAEGLRAGRIPLWSDQIYGGHPLFAEGQGGFAHPVNLLLFGALPATGMFAPGEPGLVSPATLYAHGLLHVLCGLVAALGTYLLGRSYGLGAVGSTVAGLALACSQDWLWQSSNSAIALACAFAPWVLYAIEQWWRGPTLSNAVGLGFALALMLLAGYPQAIHGVAILAVISLVVRVDRAWLANPWPHIATGSLALALALGLAAVQLLPTLELVGESVRAEGVGLVASASPAMQLRGLLFSIGLRAAIDPSLGSILVVGLAGLGLRATRPVLGLLLGTFVLFQLSAADHSPLYRALHHTLPLLDSFRITHLYASLALIGVAVLAGFGVERLGTLSGGRAGLRAEPALLWKGWLAVLVAVAGISIGLADEYVPPATWVFPVAALVSALVLIFSNRASWVPKALLVLLLAEIAVLRIPLHDFVDARILREPPPIAQTLLERHPQERAFRLANVPRFFAYVGFASASTPDLERLAGLFLSSMDASSNLLFTIASVNANLALPLARRQAVEELIAAEVRGETPRLPGQRFIDGFGVRYAVVHKQHRAQPFAEDLRQVYFDEDYRFYLLENQHAAPRMRFVASSDARPVEDAAAAASALRESGDATLFVEAAASAFPDDAADPVRPAASFVTGRVEAERYVAIVEVHVPGFLVIADALYPGWEARVNGEPAPLFAANALEKAVPLQAGRYHVEVAFVSPSIETGRRVSSAVFVLGLAILGFDAWRRLRA